ncbi:MAG: D-alanyl-lipoteichoic acid biosynthesis protein DltB [Bacillales bacterium]|nr:D-alanyl-lipoteichoic acid biosynthesis protein DltB [Bacillales bacterium]
MQIYGGLDFFAFMFFLMIPAIICGFLKINMKYYGLLLSLFFIVFFTQSDKRFILFLGFFLGEIFLFKTYLYYCMRMGGSKNVNKFIKIAAVFLALLPLFFLKLGLPVLQSKTVFIIDHTNYSFIGYSYITFKCVQVILSISDGQIVKMGIIDFSYFMVFFPTVSSGPIDRSYRFFGDMNKKYAAKEYLNLIGSGLYYIILGATYKFVLASLLEQFMKTIPSSGVYATIKYMYTYGFHLFFDFAGYSLMAVGTSYFFGIQTPQNFRYPFFSKNIKEFWDRWHITLSHWFRDYLYTRLVMTFLRKKTFKSRYATSYTAFFVNMSIMGIWHGIGFNYLLYGIYHALLLILNDIYERKSTLYKKYKNHALYKFVSIVITFNLVMLGFLIFSGRIISF